MNRLSCLVLPVCIMLAACSSDRDNSEPACGGLLLSAPAEGQVGSGSFTVAQLMAHSAAMGMTQQEAETLLYLEGISPNRRLEPGEVICVDGKPG